MSGHPRQAVGGFHLSSAGPDHQHHHQRQAGDAQQLLTRKPWGYYTRHRGRHGHGPPNPRWRFKMNSDPENKPAEDPKPATPAPEPEPAQEPVKEPDSETKPEAAA